MTKILVPFADGSEEMETVIIVDTLRRATLSVTSVALGNSRTITASRGVVLVADALLGEIRPDTFDAIVLPGGAGGTQAMINCPELLSTLRQFMDAGKLIGAVCAAPLALQAAGILHGRKVTCHPAVADQLTQTSRQTERVVQDRNLITSQGPGTTIEFALAVIAELLDAESAATVAGGLILP
jgi:4-methyl-5(b-hydroxyethyl)-thiazole monophosphate biosynthesis